MRMKTAVITGITGQDGAYLAQLLLSKSYKVIGVGRGESLDNNEALDYLGITSLISYEKIDIRDLEEVSNFLNQHMPNEIYNLAAQSSVGESYLSPATTIEFNIMSTINILEVVKNIQEKSGRKIKVYQASSSEMYGKVSNLPVTEDTVIHPLSPYAVSKAAAHWAVVNYRESYGLFACCGILFNHESYLRRDNFFIKKVLKESLEIYLGKRKVLKVGNIDVKRDFGYGPSYVEAMWLMLQQDTPEEYLICSGNSIKLEEVIKYVFSKLNIEFDQCVIDQNLYRPADIMDMYGDNQKAKKKLSWNYSTTAYELLDILLEEEMSNLGLSSPS